MADYYQHMSTSRLLQLCDLSGVNVWGSDRNGWFYKVPGGDMKLGPYETLRAAAHCASTSLNLPLDNPTPAEIAYVERRPASEAAE